MGAPRKSLPRKLRRFARARRGSAAVEFGLVALPFFLLMFGLAEISMIGFAQTSLNNAVADTARTIRLGQAQRAGATQAQIEAALCDDLNMFMVLECGGNLFVDIDRFDSFTNASNNAADPIQNGEFQPAGMGYSPGVQSDIVVVRVYYRWKIMTPMFETVFANVSNGERILVSTMMFRNEPYL